MSLYESRIRKYIWWLAPIRGLIRPLEAIAITIWMKRSLRANNGH